ncbi:hypothetical protein Scep_016914 [Stephania cephalantha]|uniref:Uncharacterized protein n=1 Tax=Stephania cephalantha TaxID=152367 RepID=A0AAP0INM5_9MAGN
MAEPQRERKREKTRERERKKRLAVQKKKRLGAGSAGEERVRRSSSSQGTTARGSSKPAGGLDGWCGRRPADARTNPVDKQAGEGRRLWELARDATIDQAVQRRTSSVDDRGGRRRQQRGGGSGDDGAAAAAVMAATR